MSSNLKKPFCKVCFDAGKPESTYTNHYVKNVPGPSGKVVCPTLLGLNCRYCLKNGHTVSHCPVLTQNNKKEKKIVPASLANAYNVSNASIFKKKSNIFDHLLDYDSEEDVEICCEPVLEKVVEENSVAAVTYASILAKPKVEAYNARSDLNFGTCVKISNFKKSWAAYDDSSSDEEE